LFGVSQAEDTRFRRLLVQRARQFAFGLPTIDMRRDLALDEAAEMIEQRRIPADVLAEEELASESAASEGTASEGTAGENAVGATAGNEPNTGQNTGE
jgi:hypothetical protein